MARLANDRGIGLPLAVVSATTFGLSGPLATGLLAAGWSPGAIVLCRIGIAAGALGPFAAVALRGRWSLLRGQLTQVLVYGVLAVAGAQFAYFSAVQQMDVAPALLIEYTAPAAVVVWLWVRRGQRPAPLTVGGALLAAAGLVLVLDLFSGTHLAWAGVGWALAAMTGATTYFLMSAETEDGLPPIALAGAGLIVGAVALAVPALIGVLPMHATGHPVHYAGRTTGWWLPVALLGLVTAAVAYATGIAAIRRLGSRVSSFVALLEVVAAVGFAWLLVHQTPGRPQVAGGLLIVAGVVAVKLGDRTPQPPPGPAARDALDGERLPVT